VLPYIGIGRLVSTTFWEPYFFIWHFLKLYVDSKMLQIYFGPRCIYLLLCEKISTETYFSPHPLSLHAQKKKTFFLNLFTHLEVCWFPCCHMATKHTDSALPSLVSHTHTLSHTDIQFFGICQNQLPNECQDSCHTSWLQTTPSLTPCCH